MRFLLPLLASCLFASIPCAAFAADAPILSAPPVIEDGTAPMPAGYHEVEQRSGAYLGVGLASLGTGFALAASAALVNPKENGLLLIPFAGPFAQIPHTNSATGKWFLAADGAMQAVGVGFTAGYFLAPRRLWIADHPGPLGDHEAARVNWGAVSTALGGFGLAYGVSSLAAAIDHDVATNPKLGSLAVQSPGRCSS